MSSTSNNTLVMTLPTTAATRKYPFSRDTLNKLQELRKFREDKYYDASGLDIIVPAPVILSDAVDLLYSQTFTQETEQ